MSHLVPEQRMDKNGNVVTRHVRADSPSALPSTPLPPPALSKRQTDMKIILDQFKGFWSMNEDMEVDFDYDELGERLLHLSDDELSRFGMFLNHTEEETIAFLMPLEREKYDLLSDMTLIYDAHHHAGIPEEPDEFEEFYLDSKEIYVEVRTDHNSVKEYMRSQGVNYQKLELLSNEDRNKALKWLEVRHSSESLTGSLEFVHMGGDGENDYVTFTNTEFLELAMSDDRVLELARQHATLDMERLKLMLSHESAITAGVL